MTNKDFLKNLSTDGFSYADSHQRYNVQLPLMFSYPTSSGSRDPNDLFKDNTEYLYYPSGVHQTVVVTNQQDRYGSFTITSSGVFSVYLQVAEYAVDSSPAFIGGPVTVSGEGGTNDLFFATYYDDTPPNPHAYTIPIENAGTHSIVFPSPVTSRAFIVTHSGSAPYLISQLLPRKLVQRYDIEVNSIKAYHVSSTLIDTIALQVSDSIVVGSGLIGEKSIDGAKIVDGTISGVLIANGTVTGNKVQAGTISGVLITAGTITGDKIQAATISGSLITAGTITFDKIASNTLTANQIADNTLTGQKIAAGTISGVLIADNTVSASKIQANTITAGQIAAGTITGDRIAASTISGALITAGTLTGDKIAAATISGDRIAAGTITADNITTRTITADRIVLSGITADLLGPEAVTAAALASGAVISGKLAANSVQANNVTAGVIQGYHVAASTITGANIAAATISGSLITAGTITADRIASSSLTATQIADGAITGQKILAGTLSGVLITDGTVSASKIQANTITTNQIAAGTITGANIAAATISGSLITAGAITADKLSVTQLDAVAGNMGNLTVNSGITIGTQGYLWAGSGSPSSPTTGLKIYTTSGVSRLTTFASGIAQIDVGSDGRLYVGSGQSLKLDSTGITFKPAVEGRLFLAGPASPPDIGANPVYPPLSNLIKFKPFYYVNSSLGNTAFYDYTADVHAFSIGASQTYSLGGTGPYPKTNDDFNGINAVIRAGWLLAESGQLGYNKVDQSSLSLLSNSATYADILMATPTQKLKFTNSDINNYTTQLTDDAFGLGILISGSKVTIPSYTTIENNLDISNDLKVNVNKFIVSSNTGNVQNTGNIASDGTVSASNFILWTSNGNSALYGAGRDGAVSFDGVSVDYAFATYNSNTYTLTRDVFAITVYVQAGITVNTAGFRIFANAEIDVEGLIQNNGGNATGVTAGSAASGGYYKASTAGAAGLGTAVALSNGSTPPAPTAATFVGVTGGRGASVTAAVGPHVATNANLTTYRPASADGGYSVINSISSWTSRALTTASTLWQMSPSMGGSSGAKSAAGTSAVSGGGGGGGGFVFIASPFIYGQPYSITAKGGNGGNASGTGGNFGGGGGGGGGIIAVVTNRNFVDPTLYDVSPGVGGTSVTTTLGPTASPLGQLNSTTSTKNIFTPDGVLSKKTLYMMAIYTIGTAGNVPSVSSITGGGVYWEKQGDVLFSTIATPTRRLEVWAGYLNDNIGGYFLNPSDDQRVFVNFNVAPVSVQYSLDFISGSSVWENNNYYIDQATQQVTNSATTLTTTLAAGVTATTMTYTVAAVQSGTTFVPGTGNAIIQGSARNVLSMFSRGRQANTLSWTGASTAAMISFAIPPGSVVEPGMNGEPGKVLFFIE